MVTTGLLRRIDRRRDTSLPDKVLGPTVLGGDVTGSNFVKSSSDY